MKMRALLPALLLVAADIPAAQSLGTKPTVVSTNPADGAVDVSRALRCLSMTFSKPMNVSACGGSTSGWIGAGGCPFRKLDPNEIQHCEARRCRLLGLQDNPNPSVSSAPETAD